MKLLGWFLAGAGSVLLFQVAVVSQYGGDWSVLLRVGASMPHRGLVQGELGSITWIDDTGHDGQINYLIARDPFDRRGTSPAMADWDDPPYRFRRILYPLLAGGGGWFGAQATFYGLLLWMAAGAGLLAAATAQLSTQWKLPGMVMLFALLNPGVYLSAQVLTNDVLALGLALAGIACWYCRREYTAGFLLAAAVLTRESSIIFSLCLAVAIVRQRGVRMALGLVLSSALPYLCWTLWLRRVMPGGDGLENLGLPLVGIGRSLSLWRNPANVVFGCVALMLLSASLLVAWKTDNWFIRSACLAWFCLAVLLSNKVWGEPGNALRALCPLWALVAIGYGTCISEFVRRAPSNTMGRSLAATAMSPLPLDAREQIRERS